MWTKDSEFKRHSRVSALAFLRVAAARQRIHQHVPALPRLEDTRVLCRVVEDGSAARADSGYGLPGWGVVHTAGDR